MKIIYDMKDKLEVSQVRRGEKCRKSSPGNANIKFKALTLESGSVLFEETKQAITVSGGVKEGKRGMR